MNSARPQGDLSPVDFAAIAELLHRVSGIDLHEGKQGLVQTRLAKRLRELGLAGYREYLEHVRADASGAELSTMVDLLTTNKTEFFRERPHFDFLEERFLPTLDPSRPLRVWSAGCSSGEEPYSLAILLRESLPDLERRDVRILATDLSTRVLDAARTGVYSGSVVSGVPAGIRHRYFRRTRPSGDEWRVDPSLQRAIRFARLNLMGPWPMQGPFDLILCRNVMIYFDRPTQEQLVQRFWDLLAPGGFFFTGHSESLSPLSHRFRYVQPAIYRR